MIGISHVTINKPSRTFENTLLISSGHLTTLVEHTSLGLIPDVLFNQCGVLHYTREYLWFSLNPLGGLVTMAPSTEYVLVKTTYIVGLLLC